MCVTRSSRFSLTFACRGSVIWGSRWRAKLRLTMRLLAAATLNVERRGGSEGDGNGGVLGSDYPGF